MNQTGRFKRVKVDGRRKWKVLKSKRGRSKEKRLYEVKSWIWTVSGNSRFKGMKLDSKKKWNCTVQCYVPVILFRSWRFLVSVLISNRFQAKKQPILSISFQLNLSVANLTIFRPFTFTISKVRIDDWTDWTIGPSLSYFWTVHFGIYGPSTIILRFIWTFHF